MFKEFLEIVRNFEEVCTEFVDVNKSLPDSALTSKDLSLETGILQVLRNYLRNSIF